ncbi:uncharacterized protein PADG_06969 [Paracoccidioides brasiliensis Pb18]|uniref:Uncharacterized protein n=1 Tax=Paracoccidioides brasiliensis (strain Pb18) TaxID=502780 RepID=C1GI83_PARBD|nr:uncharacterized protein PADG_06969 [Paracoccidioides brasiliensis Pb18]EEH42149.2 hypothetical protein PADG_06969 [Paracoccidioides brasiliensis Pb18]
MSLDASSGKQIINRATQQKTFDIRISFITKFRKFNKLGTVASTLSVIPNVSIGSIQWMLTGRSHSVSGVGNAEPVLHVMHCLGRQIMQLRLGVRGCRHKMVDTDLGLRA